MLSFVHYLDFEDSGIKLNDLKKMMSEKKIMYNHFVDKKEYRWSNNEKLIPVELDGLPKYIINNLDKYRQWLDI